MELVLNDVMFEELSFEEIMGIDGGGWFDFVKGAAIVVGAVMCATSLAVGAAAGIGASVVGTPVVGVAAGVAATAGMIAVGTQLIDFGTSN